MNNNFVKVLYLVLLINSCAKQQQKSITNAVASNSFSEENSRLQNLKASISSSLLDANNNLWFGLYENGILKFDGKKFIHYNDKKNDLNQTIYCAIEDKQGTLWFGAENGLITYKNKSFTPKAIPFTDTTSVWLDKVYPIINPNAVHALLEDASGAIWIGTGGAGAYRYQNKKFTSYLTNIGNIFEDNLHHNWITSIIQDSKQNIWFSSMSRGGLSKYNGKNFKQYLPKDGLFTDMVRTIYEDSKSALWLGYKATHDGGLTKYANDKFVNFYEKDGMPIHSVRTIFEDSKSILWLGGDLNYLTTYNGTDFTIFKDENGNTYEDIFTIIEDNQNHIWFGGKDGLWKYNGSITTKML